MIGRASRILALAITDGQFLCAEAAPAPRGKAPRITRAETFALPTGLSLDRPEELGRQLAQFLREKHFSAQQVVVGVPARWVIAQDREVPPAPEADALALLRLQAEKLAVSDADDLVFDYVGRTATDRTSRVLIVATLRRRVDQVRHAVSAAGLRIRAVTPTALALASLLPNDDEAAPMLLLGTAGADIVWRSGGVPRHLQHVPVSLNGHGRSMAHLGLEMQRGLTLGHAAGSSRTRTADVVDAVGISPEELTDLERRANVDLRPRTSFAARSGMDVPADPRLIPAVALALAAAGGDALPADFEHSRFAAPPRRLISRRAAWITAAILLVLAVVAFEIIDYRQQVAELASLRAHAQTVEPDLAAAEAAIDRTSFGRGFFEGRPPALACLRELALAFGPGEPIWTTGFSFRENGRGQLTGAAASQQAVLALLDRLKANPRFLDVTLVELREAAGAREVTFSMTFSFRDVE